MKSSNLLTIAFFLSFCFPLRAQNRQIDISFANSGFIHLQKYKGIASAMIYTPDNKILLAGTSVTNGNPLCVRRLNADGTYDSSFASNGIFTRSLGGLLDMVSGIELQTDGKILLSGMYQFLENNYNPSKAYIMRLNADGTTDYDFADNGIRILTKGGNPPDNAVAVKVQKDGKILVAGHTRTYPERCYVVRLNEDGTDDSSYNQTGTYSFFDQNTPVMGDLILDTAGNAVAVGKYPSLSKSLAFIQKINTQGTSGAFGYKGGVQYYSAVEYPYIMKAAVDSQNRIYMAFTEYQKGVKIIRYTASGIFDNSFGKNGEILVMGKSDPTRLTDMKLLPDGKILLCGNTFEKAEEIPQFPYVTVYTDAFLARVLPDGQPDTTFNGTGQINGFSFSGDAIDDVNALAITPGNKILIYGSSDNTTYVGRLNMLATPFSSLIQLSANTGEVSVYPNPVKAGNTLHIKSAGTEVLTEAELFDMSGRRYKLDMQQHGDAYTVILPEYITAVCYLQIKGSSGIRMIKVLVADGLK